MKRIGIPFWTVVGLCALLSGPASASFVGWTYRSRVTFDNATPASDYQVKIQLTAGNFLYAHADSAGNDLRFEDSGSQSLPYWIETWSTSGTSTVWVKIPAAGTTNIWMYYGKAGAPAAGSGTNTFDFFDDFSGDLSKWAVRFHNDSGAAAITSGYLAITGGQTSPGYGWTALGTAGYSTFLNGIIEGKVFLGTASIAEVGFRGNYASVTTGYKSRMDARAGEGLGQLIKTYDYPNWTFIGGGADGTAIGTGSWRPFKITVNGTSFTIACDGRTWTKTDGTTSTAGDISLQNHYGSYVYYDDIRVRKFAAAEPAAAVGAEEYAPSEGAPTVDNDTAATNVLSTSAWLNGNLIGDGGSPASVSAYWDTADHTTNKTWPHGFDFTGAPPVGSLTCQATLLTPNTWYWYTYYASNALGAEAWPVASKSFKTPGEPAVTDGTGPQPLPSTTAQQLTGSLTNGVSAHVYVYWGTDSNAWANTNDFGVLAESAFATNVSGLRGLTTYYYQCYATNDYGQSWAPVTNFTTLEEVISVDNASGATGILATSAWLNGTLFSSGMSAIPVTVYWDTTDRMTNSTWTFAHTLDPATPGPLTWQATELTPNTTYYYRYHATNDTMSVWAGPSSIFQTGPIWVDVAANASEIGPVPGAFTFHRDPGTTGEAVTVHYTLSGTAAAGVDYVNNLGTNVVIPAGQSNVTVQVTPILDVTKDYDTTVILTLLSAVHAPLGSPAAATLTITNLPKSSITSALTIVSTETFVTPGSVNLTADGNLDWMHVRAGWQGDGQVLFPSERKNIPVPLLGEFGNSHSTYACQPGGGGPALNWTDGTLAAIGVNVQDIAYDQQWGGRFWCTAPVARRTRTATVYWGADSPGDFFFQAAMDDGTTTNITVTFPGGGWRKTVLSFSSTAPQNMQIIWGKWSGAGPNAAMASAVTLFEASVATGTILWLR